MDLDIPDGPITNKTKIEFKVELHGDVVCPWCYLGKKSLDAAIKAYVAKYPDGDVFDIVWKPFILWPTAEVSAYNKQAPILGMVGPIRAPGVFDRLAIAGAQYGIQFNWDGLVGNSADANKLIVLAYEVDQRLREQQERQGKTSRNFSSTPPPEPPMTNNSTTEAISNHPPTGRSTSQPSPPPSSPPSPALSASSSPSAVPRNQNPILNPTQHAFLEALFYETLTQGFDPSDRTFLITLALNMSPPLASSPSELLAYLDSEHANKKVGLSSRLPPLLRATSTSTSTSTSTTAAAATSPAAVPTPTKGGTGQPTDSGRETNQGEVTREKDKEKEKENPYNEKKDIKAIINGVPSVLVQGRYRVGGFQKPEVYLAVFEKVREGSGFCSREEQNGP